MSFIWSKPRWRIWRLIVGSGTTYDGLCGEGKACSMMEARGLARARMDWYL